MPQSRRLRWQQIVDSVTQQYHALPDIQKQWIAERLAQVAALQRQLHEVFESATGAAHCAQCHGACCGRGHNHMTLINLLMCLHQKSLPIPEFQQECPFMGAHGCRLTVSCRPYNCISFICDTIEDSLLPQQKNHFYHLENQLRNIYLDFSERYQGAAMTGLLLQQQRLDGQSFFAPRPNCQPSC